MYLTILFGFLTIVAAVLAFLGLGFGAMPEMKIVFLILLIITLAFLVLEWRKRRKRYYD